MTPIQAFRHVTRHRVTSELWVYLLIAAACLLAGATIERLNLL